MAPIDENINETHLKWFGHVQNKAINVPSSPSWRCSRKEEKGSTRTSRWRLYLDDDFFEEKETCLALESQIWDCLTDPLVHTTQRLDGEDKDNQRTQNLLVITTQEQKILKKF